MRLQAFLHHQPPVRVMLVLLTPELFLSAVYVP